MASAELDATASSSTKLWATASKEWVIQPKPKPGRKPKKDASKAESESTATDSKGRRVQNRAAQRAFRERKQSQLAELQAKVQSYEQGEIERNVALQNIAKRLKEENEALRVENQSLMDKLAQLGQSLDPATEIGKKRPRPSSPTFLTANVNTKKAKSQETLVEEPMSILSYPPTPPSMAPSPASDGSSENADSPFGYASPLDTTQSNISPMLDFSSSMKMTQFGGSNEISFGCGFCAEAGHCVCNDFISPSLDAPEQLDGYKASAEGTIRYDSHFPSAPDRVEPPVAKLRTSILDRLPAFQPAVPLRRRNHPSSTTNIFPVRPAPKPSTILATCSGDPSNCLACADDSFGKAFCSAIRESVANETPCSPDCETEADKPPKPCRGQCCSAKTVPPNSNQPSPAENETIPTSDAWRQIKNHPNVSFADLALLADVVSRRSKCTGPRVVISPAPGSITPERTVSPSQLKKQPSSDTMLSAGFDSQPTIYDRVRPTSLASPIPIPKEDWIRQRVCEVQKDAVETALHMLDHKFA